MLRADGCPHEHRRPALLRPVRRIARAAAHAGRLSCRVRSALWSPLLSIAPSLAGQPFFAVRTLVEYGDFGPDVEADKPPASQTADMTDRVLKQNEQQS